MRSTNTQKMPGVNFTNTNYTVIGWKNKNDPTQVLRGDTPKWRIQDSNGNQVLAFDMGAGYTIENADGEVIAEMGDHDSIDAVSKGQVSSGEVVYSTINDEILLEVDMNLTGGGKVTRYDSGDTILSLESSRARQVLSLVPVVDFLFNEKWTISSPSGGHVCTASENRSINPFSKPTKSINIRGDANLSDLEVFGIMCMLAKLSLL